MIILNALIQAIKERKTMLAACGPGYAHLLREEIEDYQLMLKRDYGIDWNGGSDRP